jgi:hypothetical protein
VIVKSAVRRTRIIIVGAVASMIIGGIAMAVPAGEAAAAPAAASVSCPHGEKLILPTAHTTDALGVTRYTYRALPGLVSKVPSLELTGSRVTPAAITDLGVRVTPSLTTAQLRRDIARQSRTAPWFCLSAPLAGSIPSAGKHSTPEAIAPQAVDGTDKNSSWAGVQVTSTEFNAPINSAYGAFTTTTAAIPQVKSFASEWVGVGWPALIQAGVETNSDAGSRTLMPFFEYVNASNTCCTLTPGNDVPAGTPMKVEVYWESDTNACFYVLDTATGQALLNECVDVSNYGITHDTSTAEWFLEDALPIGLYFENLNQIPWTDMSFSEGAEANPNWHDPFAYNYWVWQSQAQSGHNTVKTCTDGSGPNGVLAYPAHETDVTAAEGSMDINTNSVDGCTSG